MPDQESSHERSAHRARSYDGSEQPEAGEHEQPHLIERGAQRGAAEADPDDEAAEPADQPEGAAVRGHGATGDAEGGHQEPPPLVNHLDRRSVK